MRFVVLPRAAALAAVLLVPTASFGQEEPPAPRKASLAVMPFTFTAEVLRRLDDETRLTVEEMETNALTNKLVTALVKTRKFDVVERQKMDRLLEEMELGESGIAEPKAAVKMGKVLGADYFLLGEISHFTVLTEWKPVPYTQKTSRILTARIVVDMRIVDTRTSKIVAADTARVSHVEKTLVPGRVPGLHPLDPELRDLVERELCEDLTLKTIDGIYPIKVISDGEGSTVSLNRGEGGGLERGAVLNVYAQGEAMVDPDTGEVLGYDEEKLGVIRVTEVLARLSKAEVLEGGPFPRGAVCRRAPPPAEDEEEGAVERPRPPGW